MNTESSQPVTALRRFVFVFPMASGHLNPSLPISRSLVKLGHEVHYLCSEQMREAIEDTGATFHSEVEILRELYTGRGNDGLTVLLMLMKEHRLEKKPLMIGYMTLNHVMLELQLPGLVRFLREMKPSAVVYCPLSSEPACWAAKLLSIPCVGLLTTAGPGSWLPAITEMCAQEKMTLADLDSEIRNCEADLAACGRLQAEYGLDGLEGLAKPYGRFPHLAHTAITLVTTSEDLFDPMTPELQRAYELDGASFVGVGPLLDMAGAKRAAGHKAQAEHWPEKGLLQASTTDVVERVRAAQSAGRAVVLASMGTVITGDFVWEIRSQGVNGEPRGLTGRELCRSAWGAVFDSFGSEHADEGPLLIISLGPQSDPLGELLAPANALCMPEVPQVEILKAGVDVFLTHGGQNSFTEALVSAVPVVVCPGFGDQQVNARKAVDLGVGLKVDRPDPDAGAEAEAVARYRLDIADALREVFAGRHRKSFKAAAARCAENLRATGGVPHAVKLVLTVAEGQTPKVTVSATAVAARAGA